MSALSKPLEDYASEPEVRPFDWHTSNCCHFAAGWVERVTGQNPMAGLKATPTERAARRLIKDLGGDLMAAWTRQLGRGPILPTLAQVGDIVLLPVADGRHATGVCAGRFAWVVGDDGSILRVEMTHATHAWRLQDAAQ